MQKQEDTTKITAGAHQPEPFILGIRDLVKVYKGRKTPAVDHVSFQVRQGDIFGILGPNGAGKTTILSILSHLIPATSGAIAVNGHVFNRNIRRIKAMTGVVPQDLALYDQLTAAENLRYFGTLCGIPGRLLEERAGELLARLGLEAFRDERVHTFSGGMKRRLNLAAGVLHRPPLLYLDEPTVGIDVQSRNVILEFLGEMHDAGTTILYTSHMMEEAQRLCNRVAILDRGRIIALDTPENLVRCHPGCHDLEEVFLELTGRALRDSLG